MPQVTKIYFLGETDLDCAFSNAVNVVEWLGAPVKETTSWNQKKKIVSNVDGYHISADDIKECAEMKKWVMLEFRGVPRRILNFIESYKSELPTNLLPPVFFGESSIYLGRHTISGQNVEGREVKSIVSNLSLSIYCEDTPTDWKGFEEELLGSRSFKILFDDFRAMFPDAQVVIRYHA